MTIRPASPGNKRGSHAGGTTRLLKAVAVLAALAAITTVGVASARPSGPATPNFNLEAVLRPVAGGPDNAFGLVKFRQPKDADTIAYLGVWVRDLAPNHDYFLQRATDTTLNDDCVGTNWLTLGQGLVARAVTTDGREPAGQTYSAIWRPSRLARSSTSTSA
jgi:hypothetical protein